MLWGVPVVWDGRFDRFFEKSTPKHKKEHDVPFKKGRLLQLPSTTLNIIIYHTQRFANTRNAVTLFASI